MKHYLFNLQWNGISSMLNIAKSGDGNVSTKWNEIDSA